MSRTHSIDVLIIAALPEELAALLEVREGRLEEWTLDKGEALVHVTTFEGKHGPIRVAAARTTETAATATGSLASALAVRLDPGCLAMCGVCAGAPGDTDLGDVVIASRVFQHDHGKRYVKGFEGDFITYVLSDRWLRVAQDLCGPATGLFGFGSASDDAARWWILEQLLCERNPQCEALKRYLSRERHEEVMTGLLDTRAEVELIDGRLTLTVAGRKAAERRRVVYPSPTQRPYYIHSAPIGSGNYVAADGHIWDALAEHFAQRKTRGVEMEAAAIGRVAHERGIPFVVAKGVMDHADRHKADDAKAFAARTSAEVLCHFLRLVVQPRGTGDRGSDAAKNEPTTGVIFEGPGQAPAHVVPHFKGRHEELNDLEQLLLGGNGTVCVVATGIGGIGKTTLVQEFVARRARELFPEGTAWLDGGRLVAELGRVSRRFGWTEDREPTSVEALSLLSRVLNSKPVLLVVDNFDPQHGDPTHVPSPGGRCRTLVTSRARTVNIRLDATRLELGVWAFEACREYLRERCPRLKMVADAKVDELSEFVARLPLGVRLLVSLLSERRSLSPAGAVELLERQSLGVLDKFDRDRGVAATFQVSYDALTNEGRQALQALAVCAKRTRTEVVEAVAGVDDGGELLDDLHARGLAEFAAEVAAPWGLHQVVRMFVLEQPGREGFESAHTGWVWEHFDRHADDSAWKELSSGVDEARLAFERLLGADLDQAYAIYETLEWHLQTVGRYPEAIALCELLLGAASTDSTKTVAVMNRLGLCYEALGDLPKAIDCLKRSITIAENLEGSEAAPLGNLGLCYENLGDIVKAIDFHQRALALHGPLGDLAGQSAALSGLGRCYQMQGDIGKAIDFHERALAIDKQAKRPQAVSLGNLGICHELQGDIPKAIDLLERALAIDEQLGRLRGQAAGLCNLAICYQTQGDIPKAIDFHERALAIDEQLGLRIGQATVLGNLGVCYQMQGDLPIAIDFHERALAIWEQLALPVDQARQLGNLGKCFELQGDMAKAIGFHERALAIHEQLDNLEGQANNLANLGNFHGALGDVPTAIDFHERSLAIHEQIGDLEGQANNLTNLSLLASRGFGTRTRALYPRRILPHDHRVAMAITALVRASREDWTAKWWAIADLGEIEASLEDLAAAEAERIREEFYAAAAGVEAETEAVMVRELEKYGRADDKSAAMARELEKYGRALP